MGEQYRQIIEEKISELGAENLRLIIYHVLIRTIGSTLKTGSEAPESRPSPMLDRTRLFTEFR